MVLVTAVRESLRRFYLVIHTVMWSDGWLELVAVLGSPER